MSKYAKTFNTVQEQNEYFDSTGFTYHYVGLVKENNGSYYDPQQPTTSYTFSNVTYGETVPYNATSNTITWDYTITTITRGGKQITTSGTDSETVTFEQNTDDEPKTISGNITRYGESFSYEFEQEGIPDTRVVAMYDVIDTSSPTKILYIDNNISKIEIDGIEQSSVFTNYTFSTTGEHTIKYTLTNQTSIGASTFSGCTSLTSINIPDSVTSIGNEAFYNCSGMTTCTIGSGVTSIGNEAFKFCRSLTSINIPDSVTSIGSYQTFYYCSGLTSCTIGSGVTSIGYEAFRGCHNLINLEIPSGVTVIGGYAFNSCYKLTGINIPSGVTSIGAYAFNHCRSLTSINIPDGVKTIYEYTFYGCSGLTTCTIGSGVTSIDTSSFMYCSNLTSIDIPDSVTSIGEWAFRDCSGLTNIDIPDSVTSIGNSAFTNCYSLTSCTIGSGVTSIAVYAFAGCSGLTSIVSNATTAPTIKSSTFKDIKTGGTLTVPIGSSGYDTWMQSENYYLGLYNWSKIEQ